MEPLSSQDVNILAFGLFECAQYGQTPNQIAPRQLLYTLCLSPGSADLLFSTHVAWSLLPPWQLTCLTFPLSGHAPEIVQLLCIIDKVFWLKVS